MKLAFYLAAPALAVNALATGPLRRASGQPTSTFCGAPNEFEVISGSPWIVFSMNYNYQSIDGSCCTGYYGISGSGDAQQIHWSSIWDIGPSKSPDLVKGYSFVGLTQGLQTRLGDIGSIPTTYEWTVSNSTAYKGTSAFWDQDTRGIS